MIPLPPDPYKILSVAQDAQLADIRAAHRKLVKLYHPDKIGADATEEERKCKEDEFKKVQKAYELLSDENERRKYDDQLRIYQRYQAMQNMRKMSTAAAAFSTPRRAETWQPESPTAHAGVNIRTAEPRPGTYTSKSPPKTTESTFKPNIRIQRTTTEPQSARRSRSYESPSPTEEKSREHDVREKEQELAEREKELKRREKKLEEMERKRAEKRSEAKSSKKEEKSSRKAKDPYVEEPNRGLDETYLSKSASKAKSGKSHKHRSKTDRSRSRSNTRGDKPVKKKESRDKSRLRPTEAIRASEIEEPSDTDTGVDSGIDELSNRMESMKAYVMQRKSGSLNVPGPAPTPPPPQAARAPPPPNPPADAPPAPEHARPIIIDAQPPRLNRSATAPGPQYTRAIPIPPMDGAQYSPYQDSPHNGRGRSRSRLAQNFYPEDDDNIEDLRGGTRSRRGSSNTYGQSYSGRSYPEGQYYDATYYSSGTSPKYHHVPMNGVRHVPGVPMGRVHMGRAYAEYDVHYSDVPHQHTDPQFA